MFLSILGGSIGIALGTAGSTVVSRLAGWNPGISIDVVLLAFGFSAAVGIIFGLWPALNAARMDPVEALRYE
jgi:putative ABC transport system permease protein